MNKIVAQVKKTRVVGQTKITATFELSDLGQGPYFSATGETREQNPGDHHWYPVSGGCIHEEIAKYFPDYEKYLIWHCWHLDRGQWFYYENSLYWAGKRGWRDGKEGSPPNAGHFKHNIAYGTIEGEDYGDEITDDTLMAATEDEIVAVLNERFPAVMEKFHTDMATLFGVDEDQIREWSKTA